MMCCCPGANCTLIRHKEWSAHSSIACAFFLTRFRAVKVFWVTFSTGMKCILAKYACLAMSCNRCMRLSFDCRGIVFSHFRSTLNVSIEIYSKWEQHFSLFCSFCFNYKPITSFYPTAIRSWAMYFYASPGSHGCSSNSNSGIRRCARRCSRRCCWSSQNSRSSQTSVRTRISVRSFWKPPHSPGIVWSLAESKVYLIRFCWSLSHRSCWDWAQSMAMLMQEY